MVVLRRKRLLAVTLAVATAMLVAVGAALSARVSHSASVTINIWDEFGQSGSVGTGPAATIEDLVKSFMAANPDIQVSWTHYSRDQMQQLAKTAIAAGQGPDVFEYDIGPGNAGLLADAGLLAPLSTLPGLNRGQLSTLALFRGSIHGQLYGIPDMIGFLGMYYNKSLLAKLKIQLPTKASEIIPLCKQLKAKGYIFDALSNNPGWQSFHQFGLLVNNTLGPTGTKSLLFGKNGRWDTAALAQQVKFFYIDMNKAGCFPPNLNGVTYDDANALFFRGKALTDTTGNWLLPVVDDAFHQSNNVGILPFPQIGNMPRTLPADAPHAWFVSAKTSSDQRAAIAKLLNYLYTPTAAKTWLEKAGILVPTATPVDVSSLNISPLSKAAAVLIGNALAKKGPFAAGAYLDTVTPATFNSQMMAGFQAVVAGKLSPIGQLKKLEADWVNG